MDVWKQDYTIRTIIIDVIQDVFTIYAKIVLNDMVTEITASLISFKGFKLYFYFEFIFIPKIK